MNYDRFQNLYLLILFLIVLLLFIFNIIGIKILIFVLKG